MSLRLILKADFDPGLGISAVDLSGEPTCQPPLYLLLIATLRLPHLPDAFDFQSRKVSLMSTWSIVRNTGSRGGLHECMHLACRGALTCKGKVQDTGY